MIEERIDKLIKTYQGYINANQNLIEMRSNKAKLLYQLKQEYEYYVENVMKIKELRKENELFRTFIESLKYAKTGEIDKKEENTDD